MLTYVLYELHKNDIVSLQMAISASPSSVKEMLSLIEGSFLICLETVSQLPIEKQRSLNLLPNYLFVLYAALTDEISFHQVLVDCVRSKVKDNNPLIKQPPVYKAPLFDLMHEAVSILPRDLSVKDLIKKLEFICIDSDLLNEFCKEKMLLTQRNQRLQLKHTEKKPVASTSGSEPLLWWQIPKLFMEWKSRWTTYYEEYAGNKIPHATYALSSVITSFTNFTKINQQKFRSSKDDLGYMFQQVIEQAITSRYTLDHNVIICRLIYLIGIELFQSIKELLKTHLSGRLMGTAYHTQFFRLKFFGSETNQMDDGLGQFKYEGFKKSQIDLLKEVSELRSEFVRSEVGPAAALQVTETPKYYQVQFHIVGVGFSLHSGRYRP